MTSAEAGRYYGYPKCCIRFYDKNCIRAFWFRPYEQKYPKAFKKLGEGFIPCERHLKILEETDKTPDSFLVNRKSPAPYPVDYDRLAFSFLNGLIDKYGLPKATERLLELQKELE